jgi:hypothetical protein
MLHDLYLDRQPNYSIRPRKNAIIIFREVKQFEFWLNLYKKALTLMIQNKYH